MSKGKVTAEERIEAARACLDGRMSMKEAGRRLGVNSATVEIWVTRYEANGPSAFMWSGKRTAYPKELKKAAVEEYLSGGSSLRQLVGKYGLRDTHTLRKWIKVYNSGRDFNRKASGGSRMKQGRETTQEERIAIVRACLENDSNFGETAIKYGVSYQQVYTWVKKYRGWVKPVLRTDGGRRLLPRSHALSLKN